MNARPGIFIAALVAALTVLAGCGDRAGPVRTRAILLFTGAGASRGDVVAMETLLKANNLPYAKSDSEDLNRMEARDLKRFRLLIVPGGNFIEMGASLTATTVAKIRNAVGGGVNYLGICAGAFLAGDLPPGYTTLNFTSGVQFRFYSAAGRGVRKAPVAVAMADGGTLEHYWEDGPQLTGWGDAVGRYPDGTPAIVEGTFGKGFIVLTGVHPEAPDSWRRGMAFATPARLDNAQAATLVRAALEGAPLAHY